MSPLSKSMDAPKEFLPSDSLMQAKSIWNMTLSSSNFISVFVGCMFTSTDRGSTSIYMKYDGVTPSGMRFSYAFITALCMYGLRKKRPFTKRYWLPRPFFAASGRPTNPYIFTTEVSAWISTTSLATFAPSTSWMRNLRDLAGRSTSTSLPLWVRVNPMSGRVRATLVNSATICLNSTASDLRNFLRAGTL